MPTPAIAYLTRTLRAQAGIVISASHNPHQDNGIKFFSGDGTKLSDKLELAIESELDKPMQCVDSARLGKAERVEDAAGRYIEFCKASVPFNMTLNHLKIVVDCAHGATYYVAPNVFEELGAEVYTIGTEPNGLNINDNCGSTRPEALQDKVLQVNADLGIGLDGDGDRVIMVDHKGEVVDGDELLYIIARSRVEEEKMNGAVVGTVMSNLGLEKALQLDGIALKRAKVGDRYVMEMLQKGGWVLGGESSGHIICLDRTTTGDGIISALQVLHAMFRSQRSLHELKNGMTKYPQCLVNVRIKKKVDITSSTLLNDAVKQVELQLKDRGRVLLRPSGTEPLIRVMVEGNDKSEVELLANNLASVVKEAFLR
jgi:phosphoglucosamine mutase